MSDEYFTKRKLYPNVDYYSGITLTAIGIPTSMFTVIFAIGRTAGWMAQWKASIDDKEDKKISRPRQLYQGKVRRQYEKAIARSPSKSDLATPTGSFSMPKQGVLDRTNSHKFMMAHRMSNANLASMLDDKA